MCSTKRHVRFTPNSDRESGLPQTVMSALPPKADMCSAVAHVCFGPKADICDLLKQKDRLAAVSPKIHKCFDMLKLAQSAVSALQLSRSAASILREQSPRGKAQVHPLSNDRVHSHH